MPPASTSAGTSAIDGARAPLHLAQIADSSELNGRFYRAGTPITVPSTTHQPELAQRLATFTSRLTR